MRHPRFVLRRKSSSISGAAFLALTLLLGSSLLQAQSGQTGAISFEVTAAPTNGRTEPVRQFTFYLLRKSYADIQKEAEEAIGKPPLEPFVDGLEVSKELKAWMKKQQSVELTGEDFLRRLKPEALLSVPEFREAYIKRSTQYYSIEFPSPRFKEADKQKDPAKYEKQKQDYEDRLLKFPTKHPESMAGMETSFESIDPQHRWEQLQSERQRRLQQRIMELAQGQYLEAKTDTDLNGRGAFNGLAPGEYWISTLEAQAVAGDARLRWDAAAAVRAGESTRIALSNVNASERPRPSQ